MKPELIHGGHSQQLRDSQGISEAVNVGTPPGIAPGPRESLRDSEEAPRGAVGQIVGQNVPVDADSPLLIPLVSLR